MKTPAAILDDRTNVAALYYEALSGKRVAFHLIHPSAKNWPADTHDTIRLPEFFDAFNDGEANWSWYRVALSFRAMRTDSSFGTLANSDVDSAAVIRRFLGQFPSPYTALELLDVAEGIRLDALLLRRLPALEAELAAIKRHALNQLGTITVRGSSPRTQYARALVASTLLRDYVNTQVNPLAETAIRQGVAALQELSAAVPVQASLQAVETLYRLLASLPPMGRSGRHKQISLPPASRRLGEAGLEPFIGTGPLPTITSGLEGEKEFQSLFPTVRYRGSIGTRHYDHADTGRTPSSALIAWRDRPAQGQELPFHVHAEETGEEDSPSESPKPPTPIAHEHGAVSRWDVPHLPSIELGRANVYYYPEWDAIAKKYKPKWCRIIEEAVPGPVESKFSAQARNTHGAALKSLLREWSRLPKQGLVTRHRLAEGDSIDIDAAIESRVDTIAGVSTSQQVYTRKLPYGRDVACGLVIDVSMSTASHPNDGDQSDSAPVDAEAMRMYGRPHRTILDYQRETAWLMAETLDRVGDQSIIMAFSSSGRDIVRVQMLKDFKESAGQRVSSRLAALRPMDATRMGAAIRHASARLSRSESKSRYVIVLSDGLPYDDDYGTEYPGQEQEYALRDTEAALREAQKQGIEAVLFLTGSHEEDSLGPLEQFLVAVPHPRDLPGAVTTRYLRQRAHPSHLRRLAS